MPIEPHVLDAAQLKRIEAVHRGFLYQHLYAAGCLLLASGAQASTVVVEADEDVEIVFPARGLYVQVKTRSALLTYSDIEGAIERFGRPRREHERGAREASASFVVIANVPPGPDLERRMQAPDWPTDVRIHWPGNDSNEKSLPDPWPDVSVGLTICSKLAASLPYGMLAPETLV